MRSAAAVLLVVGVGNSGKDVAVAAVGVAASVTIAVRSGAVLVPYPNALPQRSGALFRRLPAPLVGVPHRRLRRQDAALGLPWHDRTMTAAVSVAGFELVEAVRAGQVRVRPAAEAFTEDGVRRADGSAAIFTCRGYGDGLPAGDRPRRP